MDLRRFRAFTFDCYGTLIDWESGIAAAFGAHAALRGRDPPERDVLLSEFGARETGIQSAHPDWPYPRVLAELCRALCARFDLPCDDAAARAFAESIAIWPPFPDSTNALVALRRRGPLIVVSNVDRASFARSRALLAVDFDAVVTAEEVGAYKPDPRMLEAGLAKARALGVEKEDVLHVAESLWHDVAPASRLGIATCHVDRRGGRGGGASSPGAVTARPDVTVGSLAELVALLESTG